MGVALAAIEGKYEILAKIKEGGMGAIYKVRHRLLDEVRVVKVLRREFEDDADLNERFIQEARSAIRLRHPNVVQIFDFLLEGGLGYIVMEYIDGVDLAELVRRGRRPSLPLFLEVAGQGLRALGYLHQKGFVHRDISPDNLMLCGDFAGNPLVKMIDLGIAKELDGGANLTASGMFLGKFRYSSPEHFGSQGTDGIEPRSDLYSYGVVLYEFLTGCYPIQGKDSSQLIAGHLFHAPREFAETDPEDRVPKVLRQHLLRALDKDPERRFATAAEFAVTLKALQAQFPLAEETLEEAAAARDLGGREQPVEPGSTQDRLDLGFRHPTPTSSATPEQIDALLAGAAALHRLNQPTEARSQILTVLGLDPDNARARELLCAIDGALAVAQDDTVPWGLRAEALSEPPAPEAQPDRAAHLFDQHLHTGCALAEEGSYAEAVPHFQAALETRPDNETVRHMLSEAQEKIEAERQTSRKRLAQEVRRLRELLEAGDLDKARERLLSARRAYGDVEPLREVRREIDREAARAEALHIEETLAEVAAERDAGKLTSAVRRLERARETWRGSAVKDTEEGRGILSRLDQEEEALETAHRKAAELDETLFEVKSLIDKEKLVEADRVIFQAVETFGKLPALKELRHRLDELHHQSLEKGLRELLDQAERLADGGELGEARQILSKARIMAPPSPEALAEIEKREVAIETAQAESREKEIELIMNEIDQLVDDQNLEQAQVRLAAAEGGLGTLDSETTEIFEALHTRIADGFQERVNALIHEAGVALEARRYRAALPFLEQALELSPGDDWIADRLEQARAALAQPGDPSAAADVVEGLIEAGRLDDAESRLRQAVERWGSNPDFDGLELQLEAGNLAERNDESRRLAQEAQEAFEEGDIVKARASVSRAIELSPMNSDARVLLELLERQPH